MNGFENIEQRVRLRQHFKDEAGTNWENMQGEPDIDYVLWLENKALDLADVVGRSELLISFVDALVESGIIEEDDINKETYVQNFLKEINCR